MRLAAALAALLVAAPAAARTVHGDGQKTTTRRDLPPFDAVRLEAPLGAVVKVGGQQAVSVTIDSNLQAEVQTRVEGRTLVVGTERSVRWDGEASIEIAVPALTGFTIEGSGDARIEGGQGDVVLGIEGSGDLRWRGTAATLRAEIEGSGDLSLEGKADRLRASIAGSGDIDARGLAATSAEVEVAGSGDVALKLAGGTLVAEVAGSGTVHWSGDAKVERAEVAGSGEIVHDR